MLELPTPKDSAHLTKPMGVVFANLAPVGKIDPYFISGIGGLHHFVFGNFQQLMESLHGGDSRLTHANRRNLIGFDQGDLQDRKSTRLNSSHVAISYAVFCLKKKITIVK